MFMPKKFFLISGSLISFLSVQEAAFASNITDEPNLPTPSVSVPTEDSLTSKKFDPRDINKDGKVDIKDAFESIRKKFEKMFISFFDSNRDGSLDWKDVKAFLDFNGNGKLDLDDINAGVDKVSSNVKKIINGAEIASKAFIKIKETITSNALFNSLPDDKKGIILGLVDIAIGGSKAIIQGGKIADDFKDRFLELIKNFRNQLKSGNIGVNQLSGIKDILLQFLKIVDKWEATGNSSKLVAQIKENLKKI